MSDPFIGEIRLLPYTFAPRDWAFCNGQLLSIAQNTALFSILGTTYGGDGHTTFGLPNLKGRLAMGAGQGSGLTAHPLGAAVGSATVTLTANELPAHNHQLICDATMGSQPNPGEAFAAGERGGALYHSNPTSLVPMAPQAMSMAGGGGAHPNIQPFVVVNYCICLVGVYPTRN